MPEESTEKKYIAEWRAMALRICTGQNIDFLDLPPSLANSQPPLLSQPPTTPTKHPTETNLYDNGTQPAKYLKTDCKVWVHLDIKQKLQ